MLLECWCALTPVTLFAVLQMIRAWILFEVDSLKNAVIANDHARPRAAAVLDSGAEAAPEPAAAALLGMSRGSALRHTFCGDPSGRAAAHGERGSPVPGSSESWWQ